MKYILCGIFLMLCLQISKAQTPDSSWVYKVNYQVISQGPDTNLYQTDVYIDLNPVVVMDSSQLILKIGINEGENNIFYKTYLYSTAIFTNPEVEQHIGYIRFYLGRFAMPVIPYPAVIEILAK